jgi:hypothetical protein
LVDHIWKTGLFMLLLLTSSAVYGHHSFAVEFTAQRTITLTGTVAEVWFRNPHVRYYVEVVNADKQIENWDVRTSSPSLLVRKGWTKNTISVGDKIVIKGHPGREGRKLLSVISIRLPDGSILGQGPGPTEYDTTAEGQP